MATYLIGGRLVAGGGLQAGQITLRRILTSALSAELVLNDAETIDATVKLPLRDPVTGVTIDLPEQLVPGRDFVGIMQGDTLLAAGPVWGDPFTFPYTSRLVAAGLWSYFDHRYVLPVLAAGRMPRDVTSRWAGMSLRTIAKRLVQQAVAHTGAALPIDFEPDFPGTAEREYPGSDGTKVGDALRRLTEVEGGPDIAFRPYITADRRFVRWSMVTGSPELTQAGADWYWDVSAPGPHASMPALDRDGRQLHSRRFQTGATFQNLITNGSFEDGDTGYDLGTNATAFQAVKGAAKHGSHFGQWRAAEVGVSFLNTARSATAEPGEIFTAIAQGRGTAGRPMRIMLRFYDADGDTITDRYSASFPTSSGWTDMQYVGVVAPAGAASVQLYLEGNASVAGQYFQADMVMLTRSAERVPFSVDSVQLEAIATSDSLTGAGFPLLEAWENRSTVLRPTTLQAYADEGVLRGSAHIENRTLRAKRYAHPALGTYQVGDYARIRSAPSARGPEQTVRERIVRVSFRADGDVTVELAPQRVVSGYPVPSSNARWLTDQLRGIARRISENKG